MDPRLGKCTMNILFIFVIQCMFVLDVFFSQMYVPGTLNDVEHVLVDVGTGYYVEKVKQFFGCYQMLSISLNVVEQVL